MANMRGTLTAFNMDGSVKSTVSKLAGGAMISSVNTWNRTVTVELNKSDTIYIEVKDTATGKILWSRTFDGDQVIEP